MGKSVKNKKGGGKLSRSETVTVRLDPKLRYLARFAARKQRRTLSSFIEWAIEDSLERVIIFDDRHGKRTSVADVALTLWNIEEADRFVKLAFEYPDLLTYNEQILWNLIREYGGVWLGDYGDSGVYKWQVSQENINYNALRKDWELFKAIAEGSKDVNCLPPWTDRVPPEYDDDFDDDNEA